MVDFPDRVPDFPAGSLDSLQDADLRPADRLKFNPQPEPPGLPLLDQLQVQPDSDKPGVLSDLATRAFNPQPEPPAHSLLDQLSGKQIRKA